MFAGLKVLGVLDMIRSQPDMFSILFDHKAGNAERVSSAYIIILLKPIFSPEDSNAYHDEQAVAQTWITFVQAAES